MAGLTMQMVGEIYLQLPFLSRSPISSFCGPIPGCFSPTSSSQLPGSLSLCHSDQGVSGPSPPLPSPFSSQPCPSSRGHEP